MGRKPIAKRAMTDVERQQRRYARLGPVRRLETAKRKFLNLSAAGSSISLRQAKRRLSTG
jgi:hypothetical protein